jgi:hypothetical protein
MPKVPGDEVDKEGRPIKCAGFAFVHVKHQWMANEMLDQGKIRIGNLDAEIKPYDQMKREMSERRYRNHSERSQRRENNNDFEENKENNQNNENVADNVDLQTSPSGKVDWAEENNGNYNPNDYVTKLGQIGIGDYYVEDDSVYQTEDETASVLSAVNVNIMEPSSNFSTRPNSRLASPPNGRKRPKMPVNIPQNETEIVGEITQKLLNEGITPTANNINQIANQDYNITENLVELKNSEKRESQETLITGNSNQNIINNHIIQTPISVGIPNLSHDSFVIPSASLPYIQSPLHQTMELLANRLTSMDQYHATVYATLVEQWTQYYISNPDKVWGHLQMNQYQQAVEMNKSAINILQSSLQVPLETQHII